VKNIDAVGRKRLCPLAFKMNPLINVRYAPSHDEVLSAIGMTALVEIGRIHRHTITPIETSKPQRPSDMFNRRVHKSFPSWP
jgi:hypothetical protein